MPSLTSGVRTVRSLYHGLSSPLSLFDWVRVLHKGMRPLYDFHCDFTLLWPSRVNDSLFQGQLTPVSLIHRSNDVAVQ